MVERPMPSTLTCTHGHRWFASDHAFSRQGANVCPHCGEPALLLGESSSHATLVLHNRRERPIDSVEHQGAEVALGPVAPSRSVPEVPGYELLDEIGRGGMGVVYRARQVALDRIVALKMIHYGPGCDAAALARFRAEAEVIARLQHPNIIQVHEVGNCAAGPYLVMELASGGNLAARLAGMPQPPRTAALLVRTVARAVQAAHEKGIIHRDLKPGNIQLADDSDTPLEKCTPKISDFGLARRLNEAGSGIGEPITLPGQIMGTPGYMSPEQAQGSSEAVGTAADIYALGVLLYEALTGHPPFCGSTSLETVHLMLLMDPLPPSRVRPGLPRDLETVCLRCLEKEPARRYASAAELADDLERFLDGKPVRARRAPSWEHLWKWTCRQPGIAALTACLSVVAVAGFVAVTWLWQRAATAQVQSDRERDRAVLMARAETEARQEAQRLSVRLLLERAVSLCESGDHSAGLLWMARALETVPPGDEALERSVRLLLGGWGLQLHPLRFYHQHSESVESVAVSADGSILATGTARMVQLLDARTGKLLDAPFELSGTIIRLCPLHGREQKLVAIVRNGRTIGVHTLPDGKLAGPAIRLPAALGVAALSRDGRVLLLGLKDGSAWPYSVETGRPTTQPWRHEGRIRTAAFSTDGKWAVTGSHDHLARLWEVSTGKLMRTFRDHFAPVIAVAISPNGELLLTGGEDHRACLWRVSDGQILSRMPHQHNVSQVAFAPSGRLMFTSCDDHTARLWEVGNSPGTVRPFGATLRHTGEINGMAFTPDGKSLVTGAEDKTVCVWQVQEAAGCTLTLQHSLAVNTITLSPDGRRLLSAAADGTIRLWDLQTQTFRVVGNRQTAVTLAFRPDGAAFLVGYYTGVLQQYDTTTATPLGKPLVHAAPLLSASYSPDGRYIATGCEDGDKNVRIWDSTTGEVVHTLAGHTRKVHSLAFSPDGKWLLSGSWDYTARLWNVETGLPGGEPMRHLDLVQSVAFSLDGRLALSGADDYMTRLWEMPEGRLRHLLRHPDKVQTVCFSPDGLLIATGTKGQIARLWDVGTGKPAGPPLVHDKEVRALACDPDGRWLYSAGWDGMVRRWRLPRPKEGSLAEIRRWLEVNTHQQIDAGGAVVTLDVTTWVAAGAIP
jgi:WD40 repeat protein